MNRRNFITTGFAGLGTLILTDRARALKYYPMPSERKCAVLYATWCGSTRDAALWISEGMGGIADVFDVRENPDLTGFEHIVIGGAIRGGITSKELQEYILQNKIWLKAKIRGFFAVCGNMRRPVGPQQTARFIDGHLAQLCGTSGVASRVFLGRITKSLMDPETARMMAGMEDYDSLKRDECMTFGREVMKTIFPK
jgi:menaquinone-dependent protoporphyrinogen IX oxidase